MSSTDPAPPRGDPFDPDTPDAEVFAAIATASADRRAAADRLDELTNDGVDSDESAELADRIADRERRIDQLINHWCSTRYGVLRNIAASLHRHSGGTRSGGYDDALNAVHTAVVDLVADIRRDCRPIRNVRGMITRKAQLRLSTMVESDYLGLTKVSGIHRRHRRLDRARRSFTERTGREPDDAEAVAEANALFPARGKDLPVTADTVHQPLPRSTSLDTPTGQHLTTDPDGFAADVAEAESVRKVWRTACAAALRLDPQLGRLTTSAQSLCAVEDCLPTRSEVCLLLGVGDRRAAVYQVMLREVLRRAVIAVFGPDRIPDETTIGCRVTHHGEKTIFTPPDPNASFTAVEGIAWLDAYATRARGRHVLVAVDRRHQTVIVERCQCPAASRAASRSTSGCSVTGLHPADDPCRPDSYPAAA